TIQDLERHAATWALLVPSSPRLRAALARLLGAKYAFARADVPRIRAALGLDDAQVGRAFQQAYRQPLETIYAVRAGRGARLRWAWARLATRLESLPPFWAAYALTLTETVGAGILALPIALAGVGPLPAVGFLVVLGAINVLTVAAMAEAVARSGTIRYGTAFFGRMVADYLGRAGSLILSLALSTICVVALVAYYIGFSSALADATRLPAGAWCLLLFAVGVYFVSRESLDATVASALVVGATSISLILLLSILALLHFHPAYLLRMELPFVGGRPLDPSLLRLIFGVMLLAYFGHLSTGNCARDVLRRDPSARSLIWGAAAAQVTAMVLYSVWVLSITGAIAVEGLRGQTGTALAPLALVAGPGVHVVGSVFVVLAMGMGSIHYTLSLS